MKSLSGDYHDYLSHYSEYYRDLDSKLQQKFRERVYLAIKFLQFNPVQFGEVTREMKILITSALIQITFGLQNFVLRRYQTIYIAPDTYSFGQYKALLGHVDHSANIIVMSWPSVKNGFIIPDDAFNVALHETAHALQSENHDQILYTRFFEWVTVKDWEKEGAKELMNIKRKEHNYLREYGGQNMAELFAVSIETFFEQSEMFKEKLPKLYAIMVDLLDQDPTFKKNPMRNH